MKDPLNTEKTPYEILGIDHNADSNDVLQALAQLMRERPGDMQEGMWAQGILQDTEQRAMIDILQYNPEWVGNLTPSPLEDPSVLQLGKRAATAKAWEQHLLYNFPDIDATHSLAVLWYWWAVYEEERFSHIMEAAGKQQVSLPDALSKKSLLAAIRKVEGVVCNPATVEDCKHSDCPWQEDCIPKAPPLRDMWHRVIAYWVKLVNTAEFWTGLAPQYNEVADKVKDQFLSNLEIKLDSSEERYRKKETLGLTAQYTELLLALSSENKTAQLMTKTGIRVKRQNAKICGGTLLLQQYELLNAVQTQVDAAIQESEPGDWLDSLTSLRKALSPYSKIAELIRTKRPDEALAAIAKLPADEQKSDEVLSLKARALVEKAQQQVNIDRVDGALDSWDEALKTTSDQDIQREARDGIVTSVNKKASYLQRHHKDDAIKLLERALKLVDDEGLRSTLADIKTSRGIARVNEALEKVKKGEREEAITACKEGLKDLEHAAKLGSSTAKEQAERARAALDQIETPSEVEQLVKKAGEAAQNKRWNEAITLLSAAINGLKGEPPDVLKSSLATCYSNRAVETMGRAMETFNREIEKWSQKIAKEFSRASSSVKCAGCGRSQYDYSHKSWYKVELPRVGEVTICWKCVGKAKKLLKNRPKPGKDITSALDTATKDLLKASELDPKNKTVREYLEQIAKLRA